MKHLVVYSHPNPKSFNHAILEAYVSQLKIQENEVRVRDLYALDFDPVLKAEDLEGFPQGKFAQDVQEEQGHVRWAEILTFICPVWWAGFPANIRGYMDRVFSLNFAYAYTSDGVQPLLKGKRILVINTLGDSSENYEKKGFFKCMDKLMDEIAFEFCGLEVLGHTYFGSVTVCSDEERKSMLEQVRQLACQLKA